MRRMKANYMYKHSHSQTLRRTGISTGHEVIAHALVPSKMNTSSIFDNSGGLAVYLFIEELNGIFLSLRVKILFVRNETRIIIDCDSGRMMMYVPYSACGDTVGCLRYNAVTGGCVADEIPKRLHTCKVKSRHVQNCSKIRFLSQVLGRMHADLHSMKKVKGCIL